jgi:hypothetical protein
MGRQQAADGMGTQDPSCGLMVGSTNSYTLYMSPKCEMVARGREAGNSSLEMERRGRVTPSLEPRYWPRLAGPRLELT